MDEGTREAVTIINQRVTCQKCGEVSNVEIVVNAPIAVALASMKAARCPKCGSDKLGLGGELSGKPSLDSPIEVRANWWRNHGEIGTSSLTIWCAFTKGQTPHRDFCYPLDPDDFSRCHKLLTLIPEWRAQLETVTQEFPWFSPFVTRWDEFERLFLQELPSRKAPKLYAAMKVACNEAERLRRATK